MIKLTWEKVKDCWHAKLHNKVIFKIEKYQDKFILIQCFAIPTQPISAIPACNVIELQKRADRILHEMYLVFQFDKETFIAGWEYGQKSTKNTTAEKDYNWYCGNAMTIETLPFNLLS